MRVKLFLAKMGYFSRSLRFAERLEQEINGWLEEHPQIKIVDLFQPSFRFSFPRFSTVLSWPVIVVGLARSSHPSGAIKVMDVDLPKFAAPAESHQIQPRFRGIRRRILAPGPSSDLGPSLDACHPRPVNGYAELS
jgi:hypothetical protein